MTQIGFFDGVNPYKITKPIRLIECFAGYGSQALSLKYLGVNFEHWKISEWAVKSIQAYKDIHFPDDNTDYSANKDKETLIDFLFTKGISSDYNLPMTRQSISRMGENKIREVYNNIIATNNLVSIKNVKGKDLDIKDTDNFTYILTYSFPCQDLSMCGLRKGMQKGKHTRSGLLWEIERILDECSELPQVLIMENVPQVIGTENFNAFSDWFCKLESLGYKSYYKIMNGRYFSIPQNRERCFMVSLLGDYIFDFPSPCDLKLRLKDLLEDSVDEKYFLSDKNIEMLVNHSNKKQATGCGFKFEPTNGDNVGKCITTRAGSRTDDNFIICNQVAQIKDKGFNDMTGRVYDTNGLSPTIRTFSGGNTEIKVFDLYNKKEINENYIGTLTTGTDHNGSGTFCIQTQDISVYDTKRKIEIDNDCVGTIMTNSHFGGAGVFGVKTFNNRIRKLTPKECFRLMGVKDEDFEKAFKNQSDSSLYHLAGDSIITTCLMSIFGEMLDVDYRSKIQSVLDSMSN